MNTKEDLTGFLQEPISHPEAVALLDEAGLELWQSPEGFWAIRLKPPTAPAAPMRRRPRRSR